jgi:branched-chain amino acid transport system substrate-binding protein
MHLLSRFYRAGILAVLFSVSVQASADDFQTVLIGFSGSLSGISENFGKSMANAAELAIAEANRNPYKIDGKRIFFRLVRMDDRGDPGRAQHVANALVQSGVIGVIGGANSATSIAGAKIYATAGIPQISPAATARRFTELGYRTTFRTVGSDDDAVPYLADFVVRDLHAGRIAVIDTGTLFSIGVTTRFADIAKDNGASIVIRESISPVSSDFDALLRRIKAQDVDTIYFGGYSAQTSMFAQGMQRLEVKARLVTAMIGIVGASFFISTGVAANGSLSLESGVPFNKMAGWKKFQAEYTQRFDFNIYGMTPFSYDAAQVLIAAIRQANSLDVRKVVDVLHEISHRGLSGTISFDASGNLRNPSFTIYEAQNQRWVAVKSQVAR